MIRYSKYIMVLVLCCMMLISCELDLGNTNTEMDISEVLDNDNNNANSEDETNSEDIAQPTTEGNQTETEVVEPVSFNVVTGDIRSFTLYDVNEIIEEKLLVEEDFFSFKYSSITEIEAIINYYDDLLIGTEGYSKLELPGPMVDITGMINEAIVKVEIEYVDSETVTLVHYFYSGDVSSMVEVDIEDIEVEQGIVQDYDMNELITYGGYQAEITVSYSDVTDEVYNVHYMTSTPYLEVSRYYKHLLLDTENYSEKEIETDRLIESIYYGTLGGKIVSADVFYNIIENRTSVSYTIAPTLEQAEASHLSNHSEPSNMPEDMMPFDVASLDYTHVEMPENAVYDILEFQKIPESDIQLRTSVIVTSQGENVNMAIETDSAYANIVAIYNKDKDQTLMYSADDIEQREIYEGNALPFQVFNLDYYLSELGPFDTVSVVDPDAVLLEIHFTGDDYLAVIKYSPFRKLIWNYYEKRVEEGETITTEWRVDNFFLDIVYDDILFDWEKN